MTTDEILDRILVPRPNGSEALEAVADWIADALRAAGAEPSFHAFTATPHGFQLCWSVALLGMLAYALAIARRRYGLALLPAIGIPLLLLLEFELLWSPLSGLLPATERNVIGSFPGAGDGTLIFSAHYDTTTHFGDHRHWGPWGWALGPATALALLLALLGLARRGRGLPARVALPAAAATLVPYAAMAWFQAVGPLVRAPSPGALDNGGSVAALLRLAQRLDARPPDAATSVKLVFLAAEEERALGSWAYAKTLDRDAPLAAINLESIGAGGALATVPEDGFELRRYRSPEALVALVDDAARDLSRAPLGRLPLPLGTLTDGRSFLAHGIPALTLRATVDGGFPHHLHSARDARERLSVDALERTVELLEAVVRRVDADPERLRRVVESAPER